MYVVGTINAKKIFNLRLPKQAYPLTSARAARSRIFLRIEFWDWSLSACGMTLSSYLIKNVKINWMNEYKYVQKKLQIIDSYMNFDKFLFKASFIVLRLVDPS